MNSTEVMSDSSEIIHYEHPGIPLYIHTARLSEYPGMRALCHWHDDIELIQVWEGILNYHINGHEVLIKEGDCLLVNSRQMHYGYAHQGQDCKFSCILFHPTLFTGNPVLIQRDVMPVLENEELEYVYFDAEEALGKEISDYLKQVVALKNQREAVYEMEVCGILQLLWSRLLRQGVLISSEETGNIHTDRRIQKNMVSYIYQHYGERVTLSDIAASGHVSRSKCCAVFRRYLQQSPVEFLNAYRLKMGCELLGNTEKSITEIAFSCGFNHLSYFSKMFQESYGCTPGEYRKAERK